MISQAHWLHRNIVGCDSVELGRPLTEAEIRVQRSLEKLSVPDWYVKYSRPHKILKNAIPIECRPPIWKSMKIRDAASLKKIPKTKSPKNTPKKIQSANVRISSANGVSNQSYRITRKTLRKDTSPCISITPSTSDSDISEVIDLPKQTPKNITIIKQYSKLKDMGSRLSSTNHCIHPVYSYTFPRVSPSRKIDNINIALENPFPPEPPVDQQHYRKPKIVYTMTKNIEMPNNEHFRNDSKDVSHQSNVSNNHASFLIADVKSSGVKTTVQAFTSIEDSGDEISKLKSPSPNTRFFNSSRKSTELERIVQNERRGSRRGSRSRLIQEIIEELDRSVAESRGSCDRASLDFAGSLIRSAPERSNYSEEEEGRSYSSSDSDLAKSTSLSYKSSDSSSQSTSPPPQSEEEEEHQDGQEDVHWIPCKMIPLTCCCRQAAMQMPRTSSTLSMQSKGSSTSSRGSDRYSPGLSPIRGERSDESIPHQHHQQRTLNTTYTARKDRVSRQLFRIDEITGMIDSGYSDRSETPSLRTVSFDRESPSWSSSSSPTLPDSENEGPRRMPPRARPQIHSNHWCEFAVAYSRAFGDILRI